ncbi:endonuclease/exonuclease/phosphatase family protein [Methanococcoides alaskense]|uniref:Endonuclease/exonuclease/phosphatase family metal-dependent hydrolase n=1 Tax=Methanococcoides alaskense TaxID=325778 RepID=A0AA90TX65_9EURY|nr:endonuclease/exonuclease/phosphatase family protein [Methanococcoides alaskense]MDA0525452.1 endonuclease/exonuclease/phosphatase family protein [Methanococcoides alaskense]MDR6221613.1 endonuclease/exonuclease/phosphatase family metal-dependent hydrolase [Methanococcoides alaskense]
MIRKVLFILIILTSLTLSGCVESTENTLETADEVLAAVEGTIETVEDIADQIEDKPASEEPTIAASDSLVIGAFNVQVFGVSKADKPDVMNVLADIVRTYDVVAIQEIRDKSQTALPELVDLVNSDGSRYDFVVSERLGRTSSKEQYAYIYNTQNAEVTGTPETYPEPEDTDPFHRQPYIAAISSTQGNYDAVLMVIHTDPDEATEEINALDDVLAYAQSVYPEEDDFVIMGDFNADGSYFDEDSTSDLEDYFWAIDDTHDTTTRSTDYTYDRMVLTDTSDLVGQANVFRYDLEYELTEEETVAVSDHYPVYAEFNVSGDLD